MSAPTPPSPPASAQRAGRVPRADPGASNELRSRQPPRQMTYDASLTPVGAIAASTPAAGPSLLMELRHCYEGYAGIPQESRLLFAMFAQFQLRRFGGLASGTHYTSRTVAAKTPYEHIMRQNRVLTSQNIGRRHLPLVLRLIPEKLRVQVAPLYFALTETMRRERLDLQIDPQIFEDYLWVQLFAKTLAPADRSILQSVEFFATEMGHETARNMAGLPGFFQRRLETKGWDIFFAPYLTPYRVAAGTKALIRYHDALPLVSPHTVVSPWEHGFSHGRWLRRNLARGGIIYCVSDPVRSDLLQFFPSAEAQVHTIPPVIAPEYRPDERDDSQIRTILRSRANTVSNNGKFKKPSKADAAPLPKFFLAVATLEPRKNYLTLFQAFEMARHMTAVPIQLVIVANIGWRADSELAALKRLARDGVHHLSDVPIGELRGLYSAAHCVIAPSRAEGFDYSGIEAMACGTPVLASNIAVHKWVYGNAAAYFDPYNVEELAQSMALAAGVPRHQGHLALLRERGFRQASLYSREALAPRWEAALNQAAHGKAPPARPISQPAKGALGSVAASKDHG